ncbi:hypothetical protein LEP1GSC108_4749 [Leptospira weilii str. UI 13098]|uniref:Uncharacterized protein n=1 Tax=Leptospira weilii str. UI 13098 TaxID=1088542 RepID=M6Q3F0_9LEPT|nr:hypothetical protein LEP1GSC108_4749 [Leptospira weilii str. UI 13098]
MRPSSKRGLQSSSTERKGKRFINQLWTGNFTYKDSGVLISTNSKIFLTQKRYFLKDKESWLIMNPLSIQIFQFKSFKISITLLNREE